MNRIYQGRVKAVEVINGENEQGKPEWLDNWQSALWDHHALFQDAVNYYVVCLLALASPRNEGVWEIRQRLNATVTDENGGLRDDDLMVWRPFRRRGGMRCGMRPYFCPDKPDATPEGMLQ